MPFRKGTPKPSYSGSKCKLCERDDVDEINMALAQGASARSLSIIYAIPETSISRHYQNHVLAGHDGQGVVVLTLQDVLNIPLQMRERGQLIMALLGRALEPLTRSGTKANPAGINAVQVGFVARLLRIQQQDEQTILKLTGLLSDDGGKANMVVTEQYGKLRGGLEARLLQLAGGDPTRLAEARQQLAELLIPMEEFSPAYVTMFGATKDGSTPDTQPQYDFSSLAMDPEEDDAIHAD